jgi:gliding motility-associated-like protein
MTYPTNFLTSLSSSGIFVKAVILSLILMGGATKVHSQNLVPNYSFETIWYCPLGFGGFGPTSAPPWVAPTTGTCDIFNECATSGDVSVPFNYFGYQEPITGVGYGGFYCKLLNAEYREYLQAPLTQPLLAGVWYYVSFYVSPSEFFGCTVMNIGAYFSATAPTSSFYIALDVEPQIESTGGFLVGYDNWILIEGCFQATGGEQFITLGNFHNDAETPLGPTCVNDETSYYYVEDISVIQTSAPEDIAFDLGGPETACFSYEIDPGIPDVNYDWEDGSQNPTLVVTESGTYSLTITDGCNFGIDSIEIIIGGNNPPVDLGPDEVTICNGETYQINLNPDLSVYEWNDGTIGSSYEISTAGTYSVTLDDGCGSSTDEITVYLMDPPPSFSLGENAILCAGETLAFSFDPSLGDFLWQDGSTDPTYTATMGGQYAVTITNMCGTESDQIILTDLLPPVVDIGPAQQIICDGDIFEISIDPSAGEILWQDGSTASDYTIYSAGLYAVTVSNECGNATDMVEIIANFPPVVNLGPDTTLCDGETILLAPTPIEGTYLWQDNSTEEEILVASSGIYSLSVTNDCGTGSDDITIDYFPAIISPDLGPDVSVCPGQEVVLYANTPYAEFEWQDGSISDSLVVTNPGTYVLIVYSNCDVASDTIIVTNTSNPPVVNLPDQVNLCIGDTIIIDADITGVDFLWSDNSQNQQLIVTAPGTYSVTVSNACGTDADTIVINNGGDAPYVNLGSDIQLCPGDSVTLTPAFSDVTSWLWQDGSTATTYSVTNGGTIIVQVNNGCGISFDTVQAVFLPSIPPLALGADTSLCSGESFVLSINTPGVTIEWPDGSSGVSYNVSGAGQVYASITNSCGSTFDTIEVNALPDVPGLDLGLDQSLCPGETITISPGITNVEYLWQDGSTGNTYQTAEEETIILTISNDCGTSTDTLAIIESTQGPQFDLGPDIQVCAGESVTIQSGISGVNYLWQDGSTNPDFTATQSGVYSLQVTNNCGTATDTINVAISGTPPVAMLGPDTTLCAGVTLELISNADAETTILWQDGSSAPVYAVNAPGTYILSATNQCGNSIDSIVITYLQTPTPFNLGPDNTLCPEDTITLYAPLTSDSFQWQDGTTAGTYDVTSSGAYILTLSNICGDKADTVMIDFSDFPPPFSLGSDTILCPGQTLLLNTPAAAETILWQDGSTLPSYLVNQPGNYTLQISNECGSVADDILVDFDTRVLNLNPDLLVPFCEEDTIYLDVTQPFAAMYLWSTGESTPSIQIMTPGQYSVAVSIPCYTDMQAFDAFPNPDCTIAEINTDIYIPNIFSPNNDGINDVFEASFTPGLQITGMQGSIFDRWGNLVYTSQANPFQWDGWFGSEIMMPGVYVYVIRCTYLDGSEEKEETFAGDVTLVR